MVVAEAVPVLGVASADSDASGGKAVGDDAMVDVSDMLKSDNAEFNVRVNGSAAARVRAAGRRGGCAGCGRLSGSKAGNSKNESGGVLHGR